MTGAKFDIEKFDGTRDFRLWRIKMRALLIQHGFEAALEVLLADIKAQTKAELNKKAHSAVILCLSNKIFKHIDEFNKIVLDLANIKIKFKDEDLPLLSLTSLPASYEHFVDTLLYRREALTLEDVMATLNSKEIKERSKAKGDDGEGLYVRGRTDRRDSCPSGESQDRSLECTVDDNRECKIRGIGKVRVQLKDGSSFMLHNVMYIHELKRNLISLGTLEKERYTVKLQSGKVKVINGSKVILSGIRRDNCVYSLDGHAMAGAGKARAVWQEKSRLIGSVSENQTGRTVKKLRMDNGLEFYNREFEQQCIESEIAKHLTVVETPQTNKAEATCTAAYLINRSPSRATEKKTPMNIWSGHPIDYGKLEPRAVKYVLLGYPEGVKGYRLYRLDNESPKIVTSRNMVFNESVMYKDTLKDFGTGDQATDQPPNLTDYQLVRDREPMTRTKPLRFQNESNMAAYAFVVAEEEDTHEPLTYHEAVACEDSSKWKAAMKEKMDSLRKNKT
nr:zinc finger, CCHC-type [Tanacetum cinerariifolium]